MVKMPPLSHRPDCAVPFRAENSEVLRFLTKMGYTLVEAGRIFANARLPVYNVVILNPQTNLWQGTRDTAKLYEKMRECSASKRQYKIAPTCSQCCILNCNPPLPSLILAGCP